jgi:WD40 repeat protein
MPYSVQCTLKNGHIDGINAIAFSPCGRYLVSGGNDRLLIVWSTKGEVGELCHSLQMESSIISVVWKDKSAVFFGCENGKLYLCENLLVFAAQFLNRFF